MTILNSVRKSIMNFTKKSDTTVYKVNDDNSDDETNTQADSIPLPRQTVRMSVMNAAANLFKTKESRIQSKSSKMATSWLKKTRKAKARLTSKTELVSVAGSEASEKTDSEDEVDLWDVVINQMRKRIDNDNGHGQKGKFNEMPDDGLGISYKKPSNSKNPLSNSSSQQTSSVEIARENSSNSSGTKKPSDGPNLANLAKSANAVKNKAQIWKRLIKTNDAYSNTSLEQEKLDDEELNKMNNKNDFNENDEKEEETGKETSENDKDNENEHDSEKAAHKTIKSDKEILAEALKRNSFQTRPEFVRRFLYRKHPNSRYHFIKLCKTYVAIKDYNDNYLGCTGGKVENNSVCVFEPPKKGDHSQLWVCKFRDLNPSAPSYRFTIHNKANQNLVLDVGDSNLTLKKLKCGYDNNYSST